MSDVARASARFARWLSLILAVSVVFVLSSARLADAESKIDFFARKLKDGDFKVRVNAALALGALDDDGAVPPLCGAIHDGEGLVRKAIAKALERLKRPSGITCLKTRLAQEGDGSVKLQLQRAVEAIEAAKGGGGGGGGGGGPPANPNAKFYISLSPVNHQSGRSQGEIDGVVHGAIRGKLAALGAYQIAPAGETPDAARSAMGQRLKGYYLAISLDKFDYSDGLRVRIKVAVFSYPSKDLKGELTKGASISGARQGDKSTEDQLLNAVAAAAAEAFSQTFK